MKNKIIAKIICFFVCFIILFLIASSLLICRDSMNYQNITGFYEEEENSLDAVYIGSSNCFTFWNSLVAWDEYGINVYPYACNSQLFNYAEYMIKETKKSQPDALFIVNINTFTEQEFELSEIYNVLNYMPMSKNKLDFIKFISDENAKSFPDNLEYYLPFIRFHSSVDNLLPHRLFYTLNGLKGACIEDIYLKNIHDNTNLETVTDEVGQISERLVNSTNSLLDYCDSENVKVLFVTVPQFKDEDFIEKCNAINEIIESRGYPTLNLMGRTQQLGLDPENDYYDYSHPNIHGSIKYTRYLSEYLINNYGFKDKRENKEYNDWHTAFEEYKKIITPYTFDIELNRSKRDSKLNSPKNIVINPTGSANEISWEPCEGAEGYCIYKKDASSNSWKEIASVETTFYSDTESSSNSIYTIIPFYVKDGEKYYGHFSCSGVGVSKK